MSKQANTLGFTLAELLIALAILGEIATFTIPKILNAQQNSQKQLVFKDTIASLNAVLYNGIITGNLTDSTYFTYMQNNLNYVKYCANASTGGCWPGSSDISWNGSTAGGFVLHNGAMVTDMESGSSGDGLTIDYNGTAGPNLEGQDQMAIIICWSGTYQTAKAGQVMPDDWSTTSVQMYQNLFK